MVNGVGKKSGNYGSHNTLHTDYRGDSTLKTAQKDAYGNVHSNTQYQAVHHSTAPKQSYGTGYGYSSPGYSYSYGASSDPQYPSALNYQQTPQGYGHVSGYNYSAHGTSGGEAVASSGYGQASGYGASSYGQSGAQSGYGQSYGQNGYGNNYGASSGAAYGASYNTGPQATHSVSYNSYGGYHGQKPTSYSYSNYQQPKAQKTYGGTSYQQGYGTNSYGQNQGYGQS